MLFQVNFMTLALALSASAASLPLRSDFTRRAAIDLQNGQDAINLNDHFKTLTADSPCTDPEFSCIDGKFAQCVGGKFAIIGCGEGTVCGAIPNIGNPGTTILCTTADDLAQRIAASGAQAGAGTGATPPATSTAPKPVKTGVNDGGTPSSDGSQTSLTLDPAVIANGFVNDGQGTPAAGQVASLTSTNNFINFCKTISLPLTNGKQIVDGSCNPAPMGVIPSKSKMPSSKFVFPANGDTVPVNSAFTIKMAIRNLETGNFVNAAQNYFSAPQQLNAEGLIRGHSHVVIEALTSLDQKSPTDPTKFSFFKGLNGAAQGGILTADVAEPGLPAGVYKLSSINTAANHQPVLVPIAQHGSLDDAVYFTVA